MLTQVERTAIEEHRRAVELPTGANLGRGDEEAWIHVGLRILLLAASRIRAGRGSLSASEVEQKEDGTPATAIETRIESELREWASTTGANLQVLGEETGGRVADPGWTIAIDPIDGTYSFLAETETHCTALALLHDGEPRLGFVANPVTGELAYATMDGASRLLTLSIFEEGDRAVTLGSGSVTRPSLVNLHPRRGGAKVWENLNAAWEQGDIALLRSPGGSPAWALVEAARGHFIYANAWSDRPAHAYDLSAAVLIVRRAGGDVVDPSGAPIDDLRHRGPFIAGLDPRARTRVCRAFDEESDS